MGRKVDSMVTKYPTFLIYYFPVLQIYKLEYFSINITRISTWVLANQK